MAQAAAVATVTRFYEAFSRKDAAAMGACYAPDATFEDPAFGPLSGDRARAMWTMLCESKDLKLEFRDVVAADNGRSATAHWDADYTLSSTGNHVVNHVDATFALNEEGTLITRHKDAFDLWAWASQALGLKGWLIGWTSFFKTKLNAQTKNTLDKYMAKQEANKDQQ